jgi:hypothetical protein
VVHALTRFQYPVGKVMMVVQMNLLKVMMMVNNSMAMQACF